MGSVLLSSLLADIHWANENLSIVKHFKSVNRLNFACGFLPKKEYLLIREHLSTRAQEHQLRPH